MGLGDRICKEDINRRWMLYDRNGWEILTVKDKNEKGNFEKIILKRERDVQKQIEKERIREAKYNKEYEEIEAIRKIPK